MVTKSDEIFLSQCVNIAKEDLIARGKPIEGNEKELLRIAAKLYMLAFDSEFLMIPAKMEVAKREKKVFETKIIDQ